MRAIIEWFHSIFEVGISVIHFFIWLVKGMFSLSGVMSESITILEYSFDFFPEAIVSTLVAMLGGLIVFRIFGRS